jgi:hypothetical protein
MIYPLVTGFHWADFDFQWYIEACRSRPAPAKTSSGFHSVETFIHQPVHPGTRNLTIPAYVASVIAGATPAGTTPMQVADQIDEHADRALRDLAKLAQRRVTAANTEFQATVADLQIMSFLGKYYADKIRGATELALFRETLETAHQRKAVEYLELARLEWKIYTERASARYRNPLWTNRVGLVDWKELSDEVANDVAIASQPLKAR